MNKVRIFIFILVLTSLGVYVSCSKESTVSEVQQTKNLDLSVFGKSQSYYNHSYGEYDLHVLNVDKVISGDLVVVRDNFTGLVDEVLKQYNVETNTNDLKSITFYGKDIDLTIDNKITGFSLLRYTNEGFYQEMYKIMNGVAILDKELSREYHTAIIITSFAYFSHRVSDKNNSVLTIFNSQSSAKFNTKSEKNEFEYELAVLEQFPIIDLTAFYDQGCTVSDCDEDRENGYCSSAGSPVVVCHAQPQRGKFCPKEETGTQEGTVPDDEHLEQAGRVAMYSIRDNILSLSTKGEQYIDFYYKLGYVFKVTGTYENSTSEMKDLMHFIDTKADLFITADNSDIMINSSEAKYLRSLIVKFRPLTTNLEYQSILSALDSDLTAMTNKSKLDILGMLK